MRMETECPFCKKKLLCTNGTTVNVLVVEKSIGGMKNASKIILIAGPAFVGKTKEK